MKETHAGEGRALSTRILATFRPHAPCRFRLTVKHPLPNLRLFDDSGWGLCKSHGLRAVCSWSGISQLRLRAGRETLNPTPKPLRFRVAHATGQE